MKIDIEGLLALLTTVDEEIPVQARQDVAYTAHALLHSWKQLTSDNQDLLYKALMGLRHHTCPFRGTLIESMLFTITNDREHLKSVLGHIENYNPDLPSGAATFTTLGALNFNDKPDETEPLSSLITRSALMKLFKKNLSNTKNIFEVVESVNSQDFERNDRVVIVTKQILKPPHAPSLDTLDFAAALARDYGKQVLIVVTSEMSHSFDGAYAPCYYGTLDEDFTKVDTVSYAGLSFPFLFCGKGVFSDEAVAQGLATISAFNPEMILSVTAPSLIAECFSSSRFCFIYPTARGIPLTDNCFFHTWDEPSEEMKKIVQDENLEKNYLFAQHPGFDQKELSERLTRDQFGIPNDAFVFVIVGMRLDADVDDSFLKLLGIISKNTNAHFAFAGTFRDHETRLTAFPELEGRTTALGMQGDIMGVYNISDAFLNPTRKGGGSGIIYAMQAGLPVLSLPHGDAGMAAAGFPKLETYDDMAETAISLINDKETLRSYKAIAQEEYPKFTGRAPLVARIIEEFEKYADARLGK